jgi:hypothetical protein
MTMSFPLKSCMASLMLAAASFAALAADAPQATADVPPDTAVGMPADGQIAVRDSGTGQLRAPTATEVQALHAAGASVRLAMRPAMTKYHSSGATGARVNESFMSYSVMVKQPDGRLAEYCFDGLAAANAATTAPASISNSLPTE